MIEKTILDYLNANLDVNAYMEKPDEETRYVLIEKTGSDLYNHIHKATFAIQSYAESLYESALLNEAVKEVLDGIIELNEIYKSQLDTDYNFTDITTKVYRYQAVYDFYY